MRWHSRRRVKRKDVGDDEELNNGSASRQDWGTEFVVRG